MRDATLRTDGTSYRDMIAQLRACGGAPVAMGVLQAPPAMGRVFAIRHDVDHDLDLAVRFAEMEHEAGIRSCYFLLHSAMYWVPCSEMLKRAKRLVELGHEVGIHVDAVTTQHATGRHAGDVLDSSLRVLREAVEVTGAAQHGAPSCYTHLYRNAEMFSEFDPERHEGGEMHAARVAEGRPLLREKFLRQRPLESFGLHWEAYLTLRHDHYVSDSGGSWRGWSGDPRPRPFERVGTGSAMEYGTSAIASFRRSHDAALQLLVHPIHWDLTS